jgi:hypothetical protein
MSSTARAVAITRSPRARAEVTSRRPKPEEQPVKSKQEMLTEGEIGKGQRRIGCGHNL